MVDATSELDTMDWIAWANELITDIDKLLVRTAFTAGMYGLGRIAAPIYTYLGSRERTEQADVLTEAVAKIALREHAEAIAMLDELVKSFNDLTIPEADIALGYQIVAVKLIDDIPTFNLLVEKAIKAGAPYSLGMIEILAEESGDKMKIGRSLGESI